MKFFRQDLCTFSVMIWILKSKSAIFFEKVIFLTLLTPINCQSLAKKYPKPEGADFAYYIFIFNVKTFGEILYDLMTKKQGKMITTPVNKDLNSYCLSCYCYFYFILLLYDTQLSYFSIVSAYFFDPYYLHEFLPFCASFSFSSIFVQLYLHT